MSGRGTIKAGTYGGRRYREKRERKIAELKEDEKKFQKALKEVSKPIQVKDPSKLKRQDVSKRQLVKKYRGVLNPEGGEVDIRPVAPSGLDREIQLAVNTIPIRVDARYIMKIREALAEQAEQGNENPEDRDDGWDVADTQNALHMHGGAQAEAGVETEEGEIELGAEGRAQPDRVEMPDWAEVQPDPDWQDQPLMGGELDDLADEMLDFLEDTDEEEEEEIQEPFQPDSPRTEEQEFARRLDAAYDRGAGQIGDADVKARIQAQLKSKAETAQRPAEWGGVSGEYTKAEKQHKWSYATPPQVLKAQADAFGGEMGTRQAERMLPPNRAGVSLIHWDDPTGRQLGFEEEDLRGGTDTPRLGARVEEPEEDERGSPWIGGLAPRPSEVGRGLDYYKKDKKGKVKEGKKGMAPTDEYKALLEGRKMDLRAGMSGKDIETGTRSRAIGEGKKQKDYKGKLGWEDKAKKTSGSKFLMEERDPKTRKKTGKIVERQLTLAPHKKKIEEAWGLSQKGMSREEGKEHYRDPWEGRRAVAKEPGKQFTKRKEAETKHALYEKSRREADPEYRPRDLSGAKAGFGYGGGVGIWDTGKGIKPKVMQNIGGHSLGGTKVQQTSADFNVAELPTGISTEELEALQSYQPQVSSKYGKAFPGARDIYAPRSMINPTTGVSEWRPNPNITNPPMADAQATNPSLPMAGGHWRSGGFGKASQHKWKDIDPFEGMSVEDAYGVEPGMLA